MTEDKTPRNTLQQIWGKVKRNRPSTGSSVSGGAVSQVKKCPKIAAEKEMNDIRADLIQDFEAADSSAEVMDQLDKRMESCFQEFKEQIHTLLQKALDQMKSRMDNLETRMYVLEKKCNEDRVRRGEQLLKLKSELNRQCQYSRKDNLKIFGIKENKDEDCRKVAAETITNKLKVKILPSDISVAHRVKKSKRQKYRPIIVRCKDRTQKFNIMKARKQLKGSGVSITEDITFDNGNLMNEAEECGVFDGVWFWNGKVLAKDKKGTIHSLNLFDKFEEYVVKEGGDQPDVHS